MSLSKIDKEKYLNAPSSCPYCGSEDISSGPIDADGTLASADVECKTCQGVWEDVYQLVEIREKT